MKITLVIFAVSLMLTACNKTQSDAEIRQKIQGAWTPDFNSDFIWKIEVGGHFTKLYLGGESNGWTESGNWTVTNRLLTFSMTNRNWPDYVVSDENYRQVKVDENEIVFISGDMIGKAHRIKLEATSGKLLTH